MGWYLLELVTFRRMVAPIVIQVLFWVSIAWVLFVALSMLSCGVGSIWAAYEQRYEPLQLTLSIGWAVFCILAAVLTALGGILAVRLVAELAIVQFQIHEVLERLLKKTPGAATLASMRGDADITPAKRPMR